MPLRLDIQRKGTVQSDRVKSLDFHPTESWLMISLYNGDVDIWNFKSDTKIKTLQVGEMPVRAAKFVTRKKWVVAGCDDMFIKVFKYNTSEMIRSFKAHSDNIRCILVHPDQPYIFSSSDDLLVKMWDWELNWECLQVFEGHTHNIMQIALNPNNTKLFVSASLDTTLKVWHLGLGTPSYTLHGHEKGVNCVGYHPGADKPYIISGGDDRCIKIWNYVTKMCVYTLEGHTSNVTTVSYHPELPIIMSGAEDGSIKFWHDSTYMLEGTYSYGYENACTMAIRRGTNELAIGYNLGAMLVKICSHEPPISMDVSGENIIFSKNNDIQQANLKALSDGREIIDGDCLELPVKDMGTCDILPEILSHNYNSTLVVVCGNGEYIIYTANALRSEAFGSGLEFVWAGNSSDYAVMNNSDTVTVYENFKEKESFEPDLGVDGIFGGFLLGVKALDGKAFSFYDWDRIELVRRLDMKVAHVFWSDNGELVCLATEVEFYIMKYIPAVVSLARDTNAEISANGLEEAFEYVGIVNETVKTGIWIGECFVYMNEFNSLNYYVGGEVENFLSLESPKHIVGYVAKDNRLYLSDNNMNIVSYSLLLSVLEYETAIMRKDFEAAGKLLPLIPIEQRMKVARFLEKQGLKKKAFEVSTNILHRFELALALSYLQMAKKLAEDADAAEFPSSSARWSRLSIASAKAGNTALSIECCKKCGDFGNLLIYAITTGNRQLMQEIAEMSREKKQLNVSFLSYFTLGELEVCIQILLDEERYPEAAVFARSYMPSQVPQLITQWKEYLAIMNEITEEEPVVAPNNYFENLFPNFLGLLDLETFQRSCAHLESFQVQNVPVAEAAINVVQEEEEVEQEGFWAIPSSSNKHEEMLARQEVIRHGGLVNPMSLAADPEVDYKPVPRVHFDMDELNRELKAIEDELDDDFFFDVSDEDEDEDDGDDEDDNEADAEDEDEEFVDKENESSAGLF